MNLVVGNAVSVKRFAYAFNAIQSFILRRTIKMPAIGISILEDPMQFALDRCRFNYRNSDIVAESACSLCKASTSKSLTSSIQKSNPNLLDKLKVHQQRQFGFLLQVKLLLVNHSQAPFKNQIPSPGPNSKFINNDNLTVCAHVNYCECFHLNEPGCRECSFCEKR
ncbi:hypothetical protein QVD17_08568 [Tagetes erecta]|uniref:Uncharacterized protein n=1 Tax=Tagetes erecta TaxID=13708 RepID=A0AAD8L093_TARER|nr:hypothetical protein QVD17_08568 [Tagetes erecta]